MVGAVQGRRSGLSHLPLKPPCLEEYEDGEDGDHAAQHLAGVALGARAHLVRVRVRVEEELRVVGSRAIAYEGAGAGER